MASSQQDKPVLPSEIPRLLDEPLTDSDLQTSVSDVDYDQEKELIEEGSNNEENSDDNNENVHALVDSEVQCTLQ
jgi:hypothetical protein